MKVIKNILLSILFLILINLISALIISFNLKKVLIDGVIKETIKESIVRRNENTGNYNISEEQIAEISDDERIQEILSSEEVQELINKYLDLTIDGMIDDENLDEITLKEDILKYLKENKETISEITGEEITDEKIDEISNDLDLEEIDNIVKKSITETNKNLTTTEKTVLKGYKFLVSLEFKMLIIIMIIIDLLLIAVIQKSYHKWIKTLSKASISSGIFILIMSLAVKLIVSSLSGFINFKVTSLLISGGGVTLAGVVVLITYNLIFSKLDGENNAVS